MHRGAVDHDFRHVRYLAPALVIINEERHATHVLEHREVQFNN